MPRKVKSPSNPVPRPLTGLQRLNKVLAAAGLGSRRDCEQLILDGRIEVDGQAVTDLATKVDPDLAKITFDGSALKAFRPVYYALHKPSGVLSTNRDPSGRMRVIDLVNVKERVFSVGRLDRSSEGLMLLTNDGELAQLLAHPRYGVQKHYLATVQGEVSQADLEKLVRGVRLSEGFARVDAVKVRRQRSGSAELEIALSEGKNREIRRILARLGHKVLVLRRLAIGPLRLGQLPVGGWRPLTRDEVTALYAATSGRKKRRSLPRSDKRTSFAKATHSARLVAGQISDLPDDHEIDQIFDDEDDMLPSLLELEDDDHEILALSDEATEGTILPYDEDFDASPLEEGTRKRAGSGLHSKKTSSRPMRSPNDLRNRNRTTTRTQGSVGTKSRSAGTKAANKGAGRSSEPRGSEPRRSQARSKKLGTTGVRNSNSPKRGAPKGKRSSVAKGAGRSGAGRSGNRPRGKRK